MKIFLPSDKCNGGKRSHRPKSGQRRKNRQQKRKDEMDRLDKEIAARKDKALGIRV